MQVGHLTAHSGSPQRADAENKPAQCFDSETRSRRRALMDTAEGKHRTRLRRLNIVRLTGGGRYFIFTSNRLPEPAAVISISSAP